MIERSQVSQSVQPASTPRRESCAAGWLYAPLALCALAALMIGHADTAHAQQFPGLVLVQPTQPPPQLAEPQQPQQPQQPGAAAKAKPKVKPKPAVAASATTSDTPAKGGSERIVLLVNDDAITAREIEQRARFLGASSNISQKAREIFGRLATSETVNTKFRAIAEEIVRQNQGKPKEQIMALIEKRKAEMAGQLQRQAIEQARSADAPKHMESAREELIEERLKLQEARKEGIEVSDDEANRVIKGIAERNKQTEAQFIDGLKGSGVEISTMRARFKASFAWREVIRRKYGAQVQVNEKEVERLIAAQPAGKAPVDTQEFEVQRIVFALPDKIDQAAMARALADADALRRKFGGCKSMASLVKDQASARFQPAQYVLASTIGEPSRSMLLHAKDGDILPPQTSTDGVELLAVCAHRALQIDDKKRQEATQELQSRKFEEMANRRLRELRLEAQIEKRG